MFFTLITSMLVGYATGYAAGAVLGAVVDWFIDDESLKNCIEEEYDNAFYILIEEKKKSAVKVGIFDYEEDRIEDVELQSESGVSSSLYEGQVIYV